MKACQGTGKAAKILSEQLHMKQVLVVHEKWVEKMVQELLGPYYSGDLKSVGISNGILNRKPNHLKSGQMAAIL